MAGCLGGVSMAAWMGVSAAAHGMDPLEPLRPFADFFAGSEPRDRGEGRLAFGLALHVLFAGALGALLAAILPRDLSRPAAAIVCVGITFFVLGVTTSYVLPAWNPSLRAAMPRLGGSWVLAHAAYGATVGAVGWGARRRAAAREARAALPGAGVVGGAGGARRGA